MASGAFISVEGWPAVDSVLYLGLRVPHLDELTCCRFSFFPMANCCLICSVTVSLELGGSLGTSSVPFKQEACSMPECQGCVTPSE